MRIGLAWLAFLLVAFLPAGVVRALEPRLDVGGFRDEDREVAEEIAGFDAADRHAALIASGYPEDLLAIAEIQQGSADAFARLVEGLPREDQERVWDLVRYPGLVADLARGGAKSDAELDRIAERYPEEIRDVIRQEGRKRYSTWVEIYALDLDAEQAFSAAIAKHPAEARAAFERLRSRPDLMSLLVDNVGVATRIGAAYRADPTRVTARFDGLHQDVQTRRRQQEQQWAEELQDPEAQEDLRAAARDFADANGYDLDAAQAANQSSPTSTVYVNQYVNAYPYPYWFGYPSWYAYPYWYPATVWTHLGFRIGHGGAFVGIGLPTPFFLGWYGSYYYGYGGYWGPGYGYWGYPVAWWGGARPYHGTHYYDSHRPHSSHGRYGHSYGGKGRDHHDRYSASHQAARQHLGKDHRQWTNHSGPRAGSRHDGGTRSDVSRPGRGGDRWSSREGAFAPDARRNRNGSMADPGQRLRRTDRSGSSLDPSRASGRSGSMRAERERRAFQSRPSRSDGGAQLREAGFRMREDRSRGMRDRAGSRGLPSVSSGPSRSLARRDTLGRADRRSTAPRSFDRGTVTSRPQRSQVFDSRGPRGNPATAGAPRMNRSSGRGGGAAMSLGGGGRPGRGAHVRSGGSHFSGGRASGGGGGHGGFNGGAGRGGGGHAGFSGGAGHGGGGGHGGFSGGHGGGGGGGHGRH